MKRVLTVVFVMFFGVAHAQDENDLWAIGIGGSVFKYHQKDQEAFDDVYEVQVPRFNLSRYFYGGLSFDGAIAFSALNNGDLLVSSSKYFAMDGALRYDFLQSENKVVPNIFMGGSFIVRNMDGLLVSINVGGGVTIWITKKFGINGEGMYKYVPTRFEDRMRSHIQLTGALVFKFEELFGY